jgi:hypothetical protein
MQMDWNAKEIWVGDDVLQFNHYAFLSVADARRKAEANKNPFMNYTKVIDEFFSQEQDLEVQYLVPRLKERMLDSLRENPPAHPDDWKPTSP